MPEPLLRRYAGVVTLIGMPGGGKSTVGRLLAKQLDMCFQDSDQAFEDNAGCTIADFFDRRGEAAFRDEEAQVLRKLVQAVPSVVATGGGSVLRADNRELLRTHSHCVYLRVPPETLMHRLRRDTKRPLMRVADPEQRIHELISERDPLYLQTASVVVETAGLSLRQVVQTVAESVPR